MSSKFAVIDFETTGLSPNNGDRITEVAIVIVESGKVIDQYESLVNTGRSIPYDVQALTGITNQMTANAPPASLILPQVHQYLKDSTLVSHNASFDSKFFHSEMSKAGIRTNVDFVCTLLLSRRLYPSLENHKLATLAKYHRIKSQGRSHRALADALVTADLFIQISDDLKEHLSIENLKPHHYLQSQKQPLSNFSGFTRHSPITSRKLYSSEFKASIKEAPEKLVKTKSTTDKLLSTLTQKPTPNTAIEINTANSKFSFPQQRTIDWLKTAIGLKNKITGIVIPFSDTLRDAFPTAGYQIKGNYPFDFIKDSEIENTAPRDVQKKSSKAAIVPKNGFGKEEFANGDEYEGDFFDGKSHGHGTYKWSDGSTYVGDWVNGKITGNGKKIFSDGTINSGNFLNGKLNGLGTQIFSPSSEWKGDSYTGEFIDGQREGLGTYTWANGTTYAGQWMAGEMHGNGIKKLANGIVESGNFINGALEGFGSRVWESIEGMREGRYEGHFKNGLRHGQGSHRFSDGDSYDGDWTDDKQNGYGVYKWADGNEYQGHWLEGKMSGHGLIIWTSGATHEGNFANGLKHGKGVQKLANGDQYSGVWLAGNLDRECEIYFHNGDRYRGDLKNYLFDGAGLFTWANGAKYSGGFKDGFRHGGGTFTTNNGKSYSGQWSKGILGSLFVEWIEKQAEKYVRKYHKLLDLKKLCDNYDEKCTTLQKNLNQATLLISKLAKEKEDLIHKLDITLAEFDSYAGYMDIDKWYFCCCDPSFKNQIIDGLNKKIDHVTSLRNNLYKTYLDLVEI